MTAGPRRRGGYSLIEVVIASSLMALLATMIAGGWEAFGRPALDVDARCRLAHEASLLAESLGRDLAGYRAQPDAWRTGLKADGQFSGWSANGGVELYLFFDNSSHQVVYSRSGDQVIRQDQGGPTTVIARYLTSLTIAPAGQDMRIQAVFSYRGFTRTYVLIGKYPT